MKYEVEIDGRQVSLELNERDGRAAAEIDRRAYDLEILRPEPGAYLILDGERVFEARVWSSGADRFEIEIGGRRFLANVIDRKHRRATAEHADQGRLQLTAPMPGKVVRVLLKPGDEVKAGQGVIVVEAMKMQNEVKSAKAGRVVEVRVSEGATVNANQVLAVVE